MLPLTPVYDAEPLSLSQLEIFSSLDPYKSRPLYLEFRAFEREILGPKFALGLYYIGRSSISNRWYMTVKLLLERSKAKTLTCSEVDNEFRLRIRRWRVGDALKCVELVEVCSLTKGDLYEVRIEECR